MTDVEHDAGTVSELNRSHKQRRATIVQVAHMAGVSVATVSNYLNNKGRMSDLTREQIRRSIAALKFTPNSLVRAIRQHKTNVLGVVTYGLHDLDAHLGSNPVPALLAGIAEAADELKYNIMLFTGWPHRIEQQSGLDFLDGHIDGLLWISPKIMEPHMATAVDAGLPTVGLLAKQLPSGTGYVTAENSNAMRQLTAHLISLGHRRIAYIGQRDGSDFVEREEGYKLGLADAGIKYDPDLVCEHDEIYDPHYPGWVEYQEAIDHWLTMPNRPTAIMANTDRWAAWTIDHATSKGMKIPEDISVTGFDGSRLGAEMEITSMVQDFHRIGDLGVKSLIKLMSGAPVEECMTTFECTMVMRKSTGPAPKVK